MKNYEELKKNNDLKVADWFNPTSKYPLAGDFRTDFEISRETEKAVLIKTTAYTRDYEDDFEYEVWIPKSCFESRSEYYEKIRKYDEALAKGAERYEKLLTFAKDNGVKGVRKFMRAETILNKIKDAGLVYNY